MLKKMIQRCPNCGQWLETGRAGIIGRAFSGWVDGCVACGDVGSKIGEKVGYKNIGAFLGGAFGSYISIFDGIDNAISGEHYQFECVSCGAKWSTDDENDDQTALYEKWEKEVAQLKKVKEKWQSAESHEDYTKVYRLIKQYLKTFTDDQLIASLSDYAALCLWFKNGSIDDALEMITNSLNIFDYNEGHAIKGLILSDKEELTPLESYSGMVEISKLLCDPEPQISYLELNTYKVKFNELANIYQNQIQHIPADDRKYITFVDHLCYCPSQILPINVNSIPSEFIFPDGHPTKGVLYIVNPAQSNVYFRADEYELDIFREQLDELMILLTSLGAKSVTFRDARQHTNEQDCSSSSEINVSGNYDGYSGAGKYLGFAHNNAYEKLCNEYFREAIFEIGPNGPCEPKGLVWYSQQKDWKNLVQLRLSGKIIKDHKRISISKETSISNEEKKSIEAEFNVLIASIKGNVNTESNHLFKNNIDICWEYSVEFYPMKVYDNSTFAPSNCIFNKLESHPDQEYINQLKECLADGEIGIRERRLLDKIRVKLGISEERAYELEASLSKPKLTDDEKEYLDEYKAVAIDGVVTEKRRRLLDELRKMLDIPDERAREIEKLAL